MKTRTLIRTSMGILASGLFAAAALAAPGQQNWNMPRPAEKPALVKMEEHPAGNCDGCTTSPVRVFSNRGPVGKGVSGARVAGYSHSCNGCVGKNTVLHGKAKTEMKVSDGCAKLVCCK